MKTLEDKILSFNDWSKPWTFHAFVLMDKALREDEVNLFNKIWTEAGDGELWKNQDLVSGCKASQTYIKKHYNLADKAVANIVIALSYEWK
ncbi:MULTISPECIES: hypothetical protein [unclassified Sphingobacterium]|uniref:hypothetical protein n=1 Tax=unclassified Sphingobacterium TaxID=2609468 RepID=UPI0025E54380|nr:MULTISPECIES: hypothetical protein [unclassified Sphingobacterium]